MGGAVLSSAEARILVAGAHGLLGSAVVRELRGQGFANLLCPSRAELDLRDAAAVERWFAHERPQFVVLAAAKAGGLGAMQAEPATFLSDNLAIQGAVLAAAQRHGVERLLFVATSAMYPAEAPQPLREESLGTGPVEDSVRPYALAKVAGVELCRACNRQFGTGFLAIAPPNLYSEADRFEPARSGVLGALLLKAHLAADAGEPEIEVWGTGEARREFLHAEDLARACVYLLRLEAACYAELTGSGGPALLNVGAGEDVSIRELAGMVARVTGFSGRLRFDATKLEGARRKLLDSRRIRELGWRPLVGLEDGLRRTYAAVREQLR